MSTERLSSVIREAAAEKRRLRVAGNGSWMNAGRPTTAQETISVADERGIVDYVPDDLTITLRAGTTLEEIDAATRANDQWLPLDPPGARTGTIGATVATASSGALAHSFGTARDFILGIEFVTGKGDIVRSGGRVVKNVAGFDLMRLLCGSWGTLGVITELTLRLYALPKSVRSFALKVPAGGVAAMTTSLRQLPLAALALEIVSAKLATKLELPAADVILVRLAGNGALVDAQTRALRPLGMLDEVASEVWTRLRELDHEPAAAASFRVSGLPAEIAPIWQAAQKTLEHSGEGWMHSTFSRGVVRVVTRDVMTGAHFSAVRDIAGTHQTIFEVLPREMWPAISPAVTSDRLSRAVKRAYDPSNVLNPGILG